METGGLKRDESKQTRGEDTGRVDSGGEPEFSLLDLAKLIPPNLTDSGGEIDIFF